MENIKRIILVAACMSGCAMANAQSRWSITPEAGLTVNKENEGTSVNLGFKAGAGVLYQIKEGNRNKPSFGLKSGLYVSMQKGGYHPMSWGNIPTGDGFTMSFENSSVETTRYYLQLPVMAYWSFKVSDGVCLNLAVGPYVAIGLGGQSNAYISSFKYVNTDGTTRMGQYISKMDYHKFNPFKGKTVNDEFGFNSSSRFDWGGTASAGITIKKVSFTISYDMAWGKFYEKQNDLRIRNHSVNFTFGYRF